MCPDGEYARHAAGDQCLPLAGSRVPQVDARVVVAIHSGGAHRVDERLTAGQDIGKAMAALTTLQIQLRDRLNGSARIGNADDGALDECAVNRSSRQVSSRPGETCRIR